MSLQDAIEKGTQHDIDTLKKLVASLKSNISILVETNNMRSDIIKARDIKIGGLKAELKDTKVDLMIANGRAGAAFDIAVKLGGGK
jgi:hypothetical protein